MHVVYGIGRVLRAIARSARRAHRVADTLYGGGTTSFLMCKIGTNLVRVRRNIVRLFMKI